MAQMSTMVMCAINAVRESRNTRIKMGTMAYKDCCEQTEHHRQYVEHGYATRFLQIVAPEKKDIDRKGDHEDSHIHDLSEQYQLVLRAVLLQPLVFFHIRFNDAVGLVGHDFASANHLLSLLHHTACQCNAGENVALACFAALAVKVKIVGDIVVEVAFL